MLRWLLLVLTFSACSATRQEPGYGESFVVDRVGEGYAVTRAADGRPLGIWDLAYAELDRDDWEGEVPEDVRPIRLVSFVDPGDFDALVESEACAFGVNGWLIYLPTLSIGKWVMTGRRFDVLELQAARRAALRTSLLLETDRWRGLGEQRVEAERQLSQAVSEASLSSIDPAWLDPTWRVEEFGDFARISSATSPEAYLIVGLGAGDEPVPLVASATWEQLAVESEGFSLGVNQALFAVGTAANIAIVNATGLIFPWTGIVANTITSIWPTIPLKETDGAAAARGALGVWLQCAPDQPATLVSLRDELLERLSEEQRRQNRYWPGESQRRAVIAHNLAWLHARAAR